MHPGYRAGLATSVYGLAGSGDMAQLAKSLVL